MKRKVRVKGCRLESHAKRKVESEKEIMAKKAICCVLRLLLRRSEWMLILVVAQKRHGLPLKHALKHARLFPSFDPSDCKLFIFYIFQSIDFSLDIPQVLPWLLPR